MLFGEAKYFTHLSTGHFFFCRKFMFGKKKKKRRKHLVETVKEDKILQVDFGVPGDLYHGDTLNVK